MAAPAEGNIARAGALLITQTGTLATDLLMMASVASAPSCYGC
jgi:hypothetical protein